MISRLEKFREEYLKEQKLYDGTTPFIDTTNVSNEDIILYTSMKNSREIISMKEEIRIVQHSILKSTNTIKWILLFWTILTILVIAAGIIFWFTLYYQLKI